MKMAIYENGNQRHLLSSRTFFMICGQTVNRIELGAKEYKKSI